jgi:hypothetical protein
MVYLILLLGDYSVHRLLDKSTLDSPSFSFRDQPKELDLFDDDLIDDQHNGSKIPGKSQSDQLAA